MNTSTIFLFYLPIFIATYSAYLVLKAQIDKKKHSEHLKKNLNVLKYLVLFILVLQLIYWFILPASNYLS